MKELSKKIIGVTKKMRSTAYQCGKIQNESDFVPFGGSIRESIGPFPEFILKGRFCTRSLKGLCSPCFYSRLPVHDIFEEQFDNGYLEQVKYILDNFQEIVIKNQVGRVAYKGVATKPIYGMVCTPTGSYFDELEYPCSVRKEILRMLVSAMHKYDCEIVLHIESHAIDVIKYFDNLGDEEELNLLHQLHARVLLGFESINDFSRNVLYSKSLPIDEFERAVYLLKKNEIPVGAFVFAGLFSYTDEETMNDVKQSLIYLKEKGIAPVLMFSNTQAYTIPDVLLKYEKFKLLDSRTVAAIIKETIDIFGCNMDGDIDPWFVADPKGGPPDPSLHIFNAKTSTTCLKCAERIYNAIENLRITKNKRVFFEMLAETKECNCVSRYNMLLQSQKKVSEEKNAYIRAVELVDYADSMFEYYVLKENPWKIKAELLCYGLNISEEQKKIISAFNPFIYEKGFVNAIHIIFKDVLINVCVAEKFCKKSPYSIKEQGKNEWILLKNNTSLGSFEFLHFPKWVYTNIKGEMIGKIVRPHSNKCISVWPSLDCNYIRNGKGCKYCGLNALSERDMIQLAPDDIAEMVYVALEYQSNYEINLSGGTCFSPNAAVDYLSCVCTSIVKRCGRVAISVECTPPEDISYLQKLKNAGATAIIMSIEIYNENLRKNICPGKGLITNQRYFDSLKEAVKIFRKGNVSSVLIVGIQPKQDIIIACENLVEIGVIPTLIPFKPLDGTPMENSPLPDCEDYIDVSRKLAVMLKKKHLEIDRSSGCAACGACSLEINLEEVTK